MVDNVYSIQIAIERKTLKHQATETKQLMSN